MRMRLLTAAFASVLALGACHSDPSGPPSPDETDIIDLVPDYAISPAAEIDGAGVGASMLPENLRLTAEQKAQIAALHEAFMQDIADEVAALREIERQLRELRRNGGTRAERLALLDAAREILDELADRFQQLQEDIWAVYTPEQQAWIEAHRPRVCGPDGPPRLTEAQIAEIRALRAAFHQAVADDLAFIKQVHQQARAAHQAGATREEIQAILDTAKPALDRIRAAERQLQQDILDVLTPAQKARWCIVRRLVAPRHGP